MHINSFIFWFVWVVTYVRASDDMSSRNLGPCIELGDKFVSGLADEADYNKYCALRCKTVEIIKCPSGPDSTGNDYVDGIIIWFRRQFNQWIDLVRERRGDDLVEEDFLPEVDLHYVLDLAMLLSPLCLLIILCLISSNLKDRSYVFIASACFLVYAVVSQPRLVAWSFFVVVVTINIVWTNTVVMTIITQCCFAILSLGIISLMYPSSFVGFSCLFVAAGLIILLISHLYKSKNSNEMVVIVLLFVMSVMCAPLFARIIDVRGRRSLVGETIILVGRLILPQGRYSVVTLNNWSNVIVFVKYLSTIGIELPDDAVMYLFLLSFILFIAVRGLIGWYVVYHSRSKLDLTAFAVGIYIYAIDAVYAPFNAIDAILLRKWNPRVIFYYLFMIIMIFVEYFFAKDVLYIRFFVGLSDWLIFKTGCQHFSRYLSVDVDLSAIAFPQMGSLPWLSISILSDLSSNVVRLTTLGGNSGIGFVRTDERGMKAIHSVEHVIDGSSLMTINDVEHKVETYTKLGLADDPVVAFRYHGNVPGSLVKCITSSEIPYVRALWVINNGICTAISDFHFRPKEGIITAQVNLRSGDSGSPVFAALKDGSLRLCGSVSKGSFNYGGGNIISCICDYSVSSPGLTGAYEDVIVRHAFELDVLSVLTDRMVANKVAVEEEKTLLKKGGAGIDEKKKKVAAEQQARRITFEAIASTLSDETTRITALKYFDDCDVTAWNIMRTKRVHPGGLKGSGYSGVEQKTFGTV